MSDKYFVGLSRKIVKLDDFSKNLKRITSGTLMKGSTNLSITLSDNGRDHAVNGALPFETKRAIVDAVSNILEEETTRLKSLLKSSLEVDCD